MKNAIAVYAPSGLINGSKFVKIAGDAGIEVRFLALGGYIPGDPAEILKKPVASTHGGALLLTGSLEPGDEALATLDRCVSAGDREAIVEMLRGDKLAWCEFYARRFDYDKAVKPRNKIKGVRQSSPERSLETLNIPQLNSSKSLYIFHNYARRNTGHQFIARLSEALAAATKGVTVEHQRPGR